MASGTIVTLGIFSARAKVRNKRYFYGHTLICEHNFDYHGSPLRILLGRVIAAAILLGYSATMHFMPAMAFAWAIFFFFAIPWLAMSALRFNARNSSYRNIRFNFAGTYGGAFGAYILWPVLAGITLFTTYPLARRAHEHYNINNHNFGGKYFHAEIPGAAIYGIYLTGLFIFLGFVAIAAAIYAGLRTQPLDLKNLATMVPMMIVFGGAYAFSALFLLTFIGTKVFNHAVSR